jgi:hypothetical protein
MRGLVILLTLLAAAGAAAQEAPERAPWHPGTYFGVGAQATFPTSDFGDKYETGFGVQGMFNYPLIPLIDLAASVGWNHFPAGQVTEAVDIWEFTAGPRFALGTFFMNGETGYFSEVDEWNFVPGLGLRFKHWEYSLRVKAATNSWTSLRVGYYF